ncbi:hypothetical protein AAFC00_004330 [Neodothiora populina]|uniref:Homeobox domain-containing protein n=1 Tax=Neodothiora populina TaxID=2781224 RepID=A0ABR3PJC9_9PEZI
MPTISEEEERGVPEDVQFGEFFDFNKATGSTTKSTGEGASLYDCPAHPGDSCLCHGFIIDSVPEPGIDKPVEQTEYRAEDYGRFQDWIPRFVAPDEPCDYCRSRRLQCYLSYGKLTCTACDSLWRSCSFAKVNEGSSDSDEVPKDMGVLDTLHPVVEDVCQQQGALTSTRVLKSKSGAPDDKKTNPRFSRAAVKVLREWIESHPDNPYPSEDEKAELGRLTGLKYGQINTWLANARRRGKVGRGRTKSVDASERRRSSPVGIPTSNIEVMNWENMNPLERWKHSPPINEPAPINAIKDALSKNELPLSIKRHRRRLATRALDRAAKIPEVIRYLTDEPHL